MRSIGVIRRCRRRRAVCGRPGAPASRSSRPQPPPAQIAAQLTPREIVSAFGHRQHLRSVLSAACRSAGGNLTPHPARTARCADRAVLEALQAEFTAATRRWWTAAAQFRAVMSEKALKETAAFFKSEAGKKYVEIQPKVIDQMMVSLDAWNRQMSEDMMSRVREEMQKKGHELCNGDGRHVPDFDVDLFVIGAGSGGVRAARIAAGYGARVMIAEEFRIGGTCVIRGCVPKKLYVYASRFADEFEDAAGFGWTLPQAPQFDWRKLVAAKEKEITRLSGLYRKGLDGAKVEIVESRAVVEGPHEVRIVNGRAHRAREVHSRRDRRRADARARGAGRRACDHLERDLRSAGISPAPARGRRRLYRARIRERVRPAGLAGPCRRCAPTTSCAASTRMCAQACATRSPMRASNSTSARCRHPSRRPAMACASAWRTARACWSTRRWSPPAGVRTPRGSASKRPASNCAATAR